MGTISSNNGIDNTLKKRVLSNSKFDCPERVTLQNRLSVHYELMLYNVFNIADILFYCSKTGRKL